MRRDVSVWCVKWSTNDYSAFHQLCFGMTTGNLERVSPSLLDRSSANQQVIHPFQSRQWTLCLHVDRREEASHLSIFHQNSLHLHLSILSGSCSCCAFFTVLQTNVVLQSNTLLPWQHSLPCFYIVCLSVGPNSIDISRSSVGFLPHSPWLHRFR